MKLGLLRSHKLPHAFLSQACFSKQENHGNVPFVYGNFGIILRNWWEANDYFRHDLICGLEINFILLIYYSALDIRLK